VYGLHNGARVAHLGRKWWAQGLPAIDRPAFTPSNRKDNTEEKT